MLLNFSISVSSIMLLTFLSVDICSAQNPPVQPAAEYLQMPKALKEYGASKAEAEKLDDIQGYTLKRLLRAQKDSSSITIAPPESQYESTVLDALDKARREDRLDRLIDGDELIILRN